MLKIKFDNKGFIFIEVLFLTLIVSFTAIMIVKALESAIISNRMSALRIAAINIANARMAEIEEYNSGASKFQIPPTFLTKEDLTYEDFFGINGTVKFEVETDTLSSSADHGSVTVTVKWIVNDNMNYGTGDNEEKITKDIWIIPST